MSSKVEVQTTTRTSPSITPPESANSSEKTTAATTTTSPATEHTTTGSLKRKNSSSTASPPRSTTSVISSAGTATVSAPASTSTTSPPKRHRPLSLNLRAPDNADLALRIVSPGLPPSINEAMKSTIQLLKQIQQQQKNLIAARHGKDLDDIDEPITSSTSTTNNNNNTTNNITNNNEETTPATTTTTTTVIQPSQPQLPPPNLRLPPKSPVYASDDSDLNRLSGVKKLKRLNVPPPLSIGEGAPSSTNVGNLRPSIQSAPIRSRPRPRMIPGAQRIIPQMQQVQHNLIPIQQPQYYYASPTPYQQYYSPSVQQHPQQQQQQQPLHAVQQLQPIPLPRSQLRQVNPRVRMIPLTATATHFGRRATLQGTQIQQHHQQQQSQPQQVIIQTPSVQQQQQQQVNKPKANAVTDVFHGDLKKAAPFNSQPLSAQREYFGSSVHDETPTPQVLTINETEDEENTDVSGSITINGSNVFNFKIFNKNKGTKSNDEDNEDNEGDENIDEYNKKKFLKICETCWNQVYKKEELN